MRHDFNLLTGFVRVAGECPPELQQEGLDRFFAAPNDERGLGALSRVLYHECVHFWQVLGSRYLVSLVADEWSRLRTFEETGRIERPSEHVAAFRRAAAVPFSPYALTECWTRYWDLHTRSPDQAMQDARVVARPRGDSPGYTSTQFDQAIIELDDCETYAAPYRWLMERTGDSGLVALVFPIITFHAFASDDPVAVFVQAFEHVAESDRLRTAALDALRACGGNINAAWHLVRPVVETEALRPVLERPEIAAPSTGIQEILSGALGDHPTYAEYGPKAIELVNHARASVPRLEAEVAAGTADLPETVAAVAVAQAARDPKTVFMLPGQPEYRYLLGRCLSPPRVRFSNCDIHPALAAERIMEEYHAMVAARKSGRMPGMAARCTEVETRVKGFHLGAAAAKFRLPPEAFTAPASPAPDRPIVPGA